MNTSPKKAHGRENEKVNAAGRETALGHSVEVVDETSKSDVALREEVMQAFWAKHDIFNKSVTAPAGDTPKGDFVFYDGPPFATGLPHYGHILAGTIKDAIPRFWTMNGYRVRRKWGWDCHGLPLENLIEKKLGLATKRDIEEYGVKNFNEAARDAVLEYADDWRRIIPRMGRWVDMENDYKTMDSSYTESVWWVFKQLHEKGLVFEGFKTMHLCPRCGTTLSNFEVNQGYKDIKDIAVTVKLPLLDETGEVTDTSLLVWTTTPWTLPGNLAAAVNNEHDYVAVAVTTEDALEKVIVAKERLAQLGTEEYEILEEMKGSELVGRRYLPPFPWMAEQDFEGKENAWTILHADYVELGEEGTGAVHIAPAFGEDDMVLAKEHGVPIVHHVDEAGHFKDWVSDFAGQLVKPKDDDESGVTHLDADIEVVKALKENGKLFKKENITHSYPHCWRCDTPLLNYATTSWFVDVPSIKDKLVAANDAVNWVPDHVGKNRFGKWLEGARDWAVSRQRYWGAPLPIWKNPETGEYKLFGSLEELKEYVPKSGNEYFTMRHGESTKNTLNVVTDDPDAPYPLTELGEQNSIKAAKELGKVDVIISSPVLRARATAKIIAKELGISEAEIKLDDRIRETGHGEYEGKPVAEYFKKYGPGLTKFTAKPDGGESWNDLRQRMGAFLYSLEEEYAGKRILIISHGHPLAMLHAAESGLTAEHCWEEFDQLNPDKGEFRKLAFTPLPHNDNFELDFHRPYIDQAVLEENGVKLKRVPDVFDCWFESGSMPYGQHHYPFSVTKEQFLDGHFPAQFIAEGLDQTRGWFYSLIVLGTALFGKSPYENVIVNGLVLAEDGKKMSKSLQNYPDPMDLANRTGVDAMRFYLLSSPIMRGEDLNFSEKEVLELQRKNIGRLHNVLAMYEMYADDTEARADSTNVLDVWILSRLQQLVNESTAGYKNYELDKATRPITDFIDDLSVWYLRRSRDRLKSDDQVDKTKALATLRYVFQNLSLVMAPAMPFYAEYLWQQVKDEDDAESVHLAAWPSEGTVDDARLEAMEQTRLIVREALEARTKAGIKVRQPIRRVTGPELADPYAQIVCDELNAKAYSPAELVAIDTVLTNELLAEGAVRELMRAVQGMRKDEKLETQDRIQLFITTDQAGVAALKAHEVEFKKTVGADSIEFTDQAAGTDVAAGEYQFMVTMTR